MTTQTTPAAMKDRPAPLSLMLLLAQSHLEPLNSLLDAGGTNPVATAPRF